jgi:hypothetical protein
MADLLVKTQTGGHGFSRAEKRTPHDAALAAAGVLRDPPQP